MTSLIEEFPTIAEQVDADFYKFMHKSPSDAVHLFEFSQDVCHAIGDTDRDQILADLEQAGLLHLPYDKIALRFPMDAVSKNLDNRDIGHGTHVTYRLAGPLG